jgi:hypothetical protein
MLVTDVPVHRLDMSLGVSLMLQMLMVACNKHVKLI